MEYRLLGASGLKVSAFSFGAMTFGGENSRFAAVGGNGLEGARRHVDTCLEAGVNLFDTADVYAAGQSEEILGAALGSRRKDVLIATKAALSAAPSPGPNDRGASRLHLVRSCEASLKRLGTDYIDIYQIHGQDMLTRPEETLRTLDNMISAGKVRYIGSSNFSGWNMMKHLATSDRMNLERFVSQQIQYSLIFRDSEDELLPLGIDQGVGAMVWSPLSSGYLTGKFKGGSDPGGTRLTNLGLLNGMDSPHARKVVEAVEAVAADRGVSPSQVALNWVVRKPGVATVLVGARNDEQLADNLKASTWSLSDAEISTLDAVSRLPDRYPYSHQRNMTGDRNPPPGLLPPVKEAAPT